MTRIERILTDLLGGKTGIIALWLAFGTDLMAQKLPDLIPYRKGELWGYADSTKKIIIEPGWKYVGHFNGEGAVVGMAWDCYGLINRNGEVILPLEFKRIHFADTNRYWAVDSNYHFALYSSSGNKLNPLNFIGFPEKYKNGRARVTAVIGRDTLSGFLDRNGKAIIPLTYERILDGFFQNGFISARKNGKWGVIDTLEKVVIGFKYDSHVGGYSLCDYIPVVYEKKKYWMLKSGELMNYCDSCEEYKKYRSCTFSTATKEELEEFYGTWNTDLIRVDSCIDHDNIGEIHICRYGLLSPGGFRIMPTTCESIGNFFNDRAVFSLGNKFGFIDKNGRQIRPAIYEELDYPWHFVNGCIIAQDINTKGQIYSLGYVDIYGTEYWED